jgi:hypothetical protein
MKSNYYNGIYNKSEGIMTVPSSGIRYASSTLEDYNRRVPLWKFDNNSGFGIYLWEHNEREIEDGWLLWARRLKEYLSEPPGPFTA